MSSTAAAAQAASQPASNLSPMQQELLNRADKIFDWIGNSVDKVGDLAIQGGKAVAEQIPDIAYQYVAYGRASLTTYVILGLLFLALSYHCVWRVGIRNKLNLPNYHNWSGENWAVSRIIIMMGGGAGGFIIGSILVFNNLKELFLVWFAPKVWLMLELVHLVKMVKG